MYTLTPNRHFVLDVHPRYPQVVLAAGFSGHGFKFASAVGEVLADLTETGQTPHPIDMFRQCRLVPG
jgi:sarcosine oxidase